ncbi:MULTISPECIES: DUF4235 domain-containing protein [Halomonadaceae]|uniref:DUF4235 domain-containing protein n=1 Tax=Modicisalibacter zincidurans TaxID=1178777 RepID=A0ABP9R5L6_9GAMM|nr:MULTISPECIES: DUF4235 domain-containing protein [Halomonas]MCD6007877.1 DUF4235 domain-containing protein [Halomonas sp. IOP_31]
MKDETLWSLLSTGAAIAAGVAARNGARKSYERKIGKPPLDPYERDVKWRHALLWGAGTGMIVGVSRIIGRRAGSEAVRRVQRRRQRRQRLLDYGPRPLG